MKARIPKSETQRLARYMNGLKYNIQDELSLFCPQSVHQCYQMATKIEDKQKRRGEQNNRGRGNNFRVRGRFPGRGPSPRQQGDSNHLKFDKEN